jgi:peptidoglycan/LPS O-acetylase OafA/YrhL
MPRIFRRFIAVLTEDEKFLEIVEAIEGIVSKILSIGMIFVTIIAISHLSYALVEKLLLTIERPNNDSFNSTLFELFGLF